MYVCASVHVCMCVCVCVCVCVQDKRKDMGKHYDSNMESHLSLLMGRVMELTMTNDMLRDELCTAKRSAMLIHRDRLSLSLSL